MLIKCPECGKEVSSKAASCPNCGCPNDEFKDLNFAKDNLENRERKNCDKEIVYDIIKIYSNPKDEIDNIAKNISGILKVGLSDAYIIVEDCLSDVDTGERERDDLQAVVLDICKKYSSKEKYKAAKELMDKTGLQLEESAEIVKQYFSENQLDINSFLEDKYPKEFHGIYKYTLWGGKQEIHCPRCGSEDCSHYQERKIVPGKAKTRYTANLNPFKPFALVNKKEKVVRKERLVTESKFLCNKCGNIFG